MTTSTSHGPRPRLGGAARPVGDPSVWKTQGACADGADAALFFPETLTRPELAAANERAKEICAECPVRSVCLEYALSTPEHYGVWGGMSAGERRKERKRRRQARQERKEARRATTTRKVRIRCGHCGQQGDRSGYGPNRELLIGPCWNRWSRAGKPDFVPGVRQVRRAQAVPA